MLQSKRGKLLKFFKLYSKVLQSFYLHIETIYAKLNKTLEAQSKIKKINDARQTGEEQEMVSKEDDDPQLMGEAKNAMNDVFDMNVNSDDDLSLEDRINMLNTDQRHVFDKIHKHLLHQQ